MPNELIVVPQPLPEPKNGSDSQSSYVPDADILYLSFSGTFIRWRNGLWRTLAREIIEREFNDRLDRKGIFKNRPSPGARVTNLRRKRFLSANFVPPFALPSLGPWNETDEPIPVDRIINCQGGYIDVDTMQLVPHRTWANIVFTTQIPCAWNPAAKCPLFLQFLEQTIPDPDQRQTAIEFLAHCLVPDNSHKKFLAIIGSPDTGKSVLIDVFVMLIGEGNCSNLTIQLMGTQFGLAGIIGKPVNFAAETKWPTRDEEALIKAVVGNDRLTADIKNKEQVNFHPITRLVFTGNYLPHFNDESGAIWNRCIIIDCPNPVPKEKQDLHLREKLRAELEGIFALCVDALATLYQRGTFQMSHSMLALVEKAKAESNHLEDFCKTWFEASPAELIAEAEVTHAYRQFCLEGNFKVVADIRAIKRQLQKIWGIDDKRHQKRNGLHQVAAIKGLRFVRSRARLEIEDELEEQARLKREQIESLVREQKQANRKTSEAVMRQRFAAEDAARAAAKDAARAGQAVTAKKQVEQKIKALVRKSKKPKSELDALLEVVDEQIGRDKESLDKLVATKEELIEQDAAVTELARAELAAPVVEPDDDSEIADLLDLLGGIDE